MKKHLLSSLGLFTATAALALTSTAGCDRKSETAGHAETTGAQQDKPTVDKVKEAPAAYYGKKLTLTGEVDSPHADMREFTLEGSEGIFDNDIRVLTKSPVKMGGAPLAEDQRVIVTGTVRRFTTAEVEREVGWDLSPELEVELRDKPVLVAEEIRRVEPSATWTDKTPEGEIIGTMMLVTAVTPEALAGQKIRIDKAKVQSTTSKGVWIGSSHADQTFVMPTGDADLSKIKAGDMVDVRGTVKKTPPVDEAIKAWGATPTMRGVIQGEPLYVEATQLQPAEKKEKGEKAGGDKKAKTANP